MTYNQFVQVVEMKVKEVVDENTVVNTYTAEKNNGVKRCGITISQKEINISPTIYLEEYYEKFCTGYELEDIIHDIICLYHEVRLQKSWDENKINTFERVENKIIYRLVNLEANREMLKQIPYVPYLNLAIVFYVVLEMNHLGTASMMIKNEHLEMWKVDANMIYQKAQSNTWRLFPSEFHSMKVLMETNKNTKSYMGEDILYVLSNNLRNFGAAVILYDGCLEMIGELLKDNFYVLPSSIHEVIIVGEQNAPWGGAGLSEMVAEINRTQVDEEDVLSDFVYYYDREKKKLL